MATREITMPPPSKMVILSQTMTYSGMAYPRNLPIFSSRQHNRVKFFGGNTSHDIQTTLTGRFNT
ncbi:MAG: hypothetical protein K8L91_12310, partial [Anaerolineae bacterium]|nr:hypothetical protein [Anaerolineae bacterium]